MCFTLLRCGRRKFEECVVAVHLTGMNSTASLVGVNVIALAVCKAQSEIWHFVAFTFTGHSIYVVATTLENCQLLFDFFVFCLKLPRAYRISGIGHRVRMVGSDKQNGIAIVDGAVCIFNGFGKFSRLIQRQMTLCVV